MKTPETTPIHVEIDHLRRQSEALLQEIERRVVDGIDRARTAVAEARSVGARLRDNGRLVLGLGAGLAVTASALAYYRRSRRRGLPSLVERYRGQLEGVVLPRRRPFGVRVLEDLIGAAAGLLLRRYGPPLARQVARWVQEEMEPRRLPAPSPSRAHPQAPIARPPL